MPVVSPFRRVFANLFGPARDRPVPMLDTVPAQAQAKVDDGVRASLRRSLGAKASDPNIARLIDKVGDQRFYDEVARIDTASAADWVEMGRVQRAFHKAEPTFDPRTRAYSESMRVTLHAALIEHMASPLLRGKRDLFEQFLELHVTAFHENGGWLDDMKIPTGGALDVLEATPFEMVMNAHELLEGNWRVDDATVKAAAMVRDARRAAIVGVSGGAAPA